MSTFFIKNITSIFSSFLDEEKFIFRCSFADDYGSIAIYQRENLWIKFEEVLRSADTSVQFTYNDSDLGVSVKSLSSAQWHYPKSLILKGTKSLDELIAESKIVQNISNDEYLVSLKDFIDENFEKIIESLPKS